MQSFFEQFHGITQDKYRYLRLKDLIVDPQSMQLQVVFSVPYQVYAESFSDTDKEQILQACRSILPPQFDLDIRYSRCQVDVGIVRSFLHTCLKNRYKALTGQLDEDRAEIQVLDDAVTITIPATDYIVTYCKEAQVDQKIADYLESMYAVPTTIKWVADGKIDTDAIVNQKYEEIYVDTGRITTTSHRCLIGKSIEGCARYIEKYTKPSDSVCVCGTVKEMERRIAKKNNRIYYTFKIDDSTGEMACVAFTRATKNGTLDGVKDGDTIVMNGKLEEDTFRKGLRLFVTTLALCKIDFEELATRRAELAKVSKKKSRSASIFPYVDEHPKSLLDMQTQPCKYLQEHSVVVFDLETTGINPVNDRIIEIGAVKIEQGEIVSVYETMVDPRMPIPPSATQVNNITDEQVADAPYIEDVLDSFLQYCDGCTVVAHNAPFDVSFVRSACAKEGKVFDPPVLDTLKLAQKYRPDLKRFNLGFLCRTYEIPLENAHRAYFDAEATAKLFMRLANENDMQ